MTQTQERRSNGNGTRHPRRVAERIPPHSIEIEECLLGAMLLTREARDLGFMLAASDFYKPVHAQIFSALEALHARGGAIDHATVADELAKNGVAFGRRDLSRLSAATPMSAHARHYVEEIAVRSACRKALFYVDEVSEAAYAADIARLDELLADPMSIVLGTLADLVPADPPIDVNSMSAEISHDWLVTQLLERGDRLIISGGEGGGKTTFFRQIDVQLAAGIHPFTLFPIDPLRVMHFDFQDSPRQSSREFALLRDRLSKPLPDGQLLVHHRRKGMNFLSAADFRWLYDSVGKAGAQVVSFGPLYKTFRAPAGMKKHDEEVAEMVADRLDALCTELGVALLIEAHSPHGFANDRAGFRPYGASLWQRWPEFGFGMKPMKVRENEDAPRGVHLRRFRLDRDRDRLWPTRLFYGSVWPWEAPGEDVL